MSHVNDYMVIRKALAKFCAEHNIIYQVHDARFKSGKLIDDPVVMAESLYLRNLRMDSWKRLSPAEREHWGNTFNLCQEIGHFRHKRDVGARRFVCITCCCMFDADPDDLSLNIYGATGTYMPGTIDPPPVELRQYDGGQS